MGSLRRLAGFMMIGAFVCSSAGGRARAEGVLSLGVLHAGPPGRPHQQATRAVAQRLERMGEELLRPRLTAAERRCRMPECLAEIAGRHGAGRILFGEVQEVERRTYQIQVWLHEAGKLAAEEQICEDCDATAVGAAAASAAGRLVERSAAARRSGPAVVELPEEEKKATQAVAVWTPERRPGPATGRTRLAMGLLGTFLGATLVTAIALTAVDGQQVPGGCPGLEGGWHPMCRYRLSGYYGIGYALSGVLAGGLVVTIVLSRQKKGG